MQFYKYEYVWGRDMLMSAYVRNECGLVSVHGESKLWYEIDQTCYVVDVRACVYLEDYSQLDLLNDKHLWMDEIFIFPEDAHQ